MNGSIRLVFFVLLLAVNSVALAQNSKSKLETQKKKEQKKISESEKILKEVEGKESVSIGRLNALNQQIKDRENLMKTLNDEVDFLSEELKKQENVISDLEKDLEDILKEYGEMLYLAQKANNGFQRILLIFSSSNFREFFLRMKYLQQYAEARNKQIVVIKETRKELLGQKQIFELQKAEKEIALRSKLAEQKQLETLKDKQASLLASLSKQKKSLRRDIEKYKREVKKLDQLIAKVVKKEIALAMAKKKKDEEAKAKANIKNAKASVKTPSASISSGASFGKYKKKIPWPVGYGFVSRKFGKIEHPVLKGISIQNQGVDIQTKKGEKARAVYDGVVKSIAQVPGAMNNVVIVQHGQYFTVYAKLKSVTVKNGDKIAKGQEVGVVYTDKSGRTELQFQLWHKQQNLNPEYWLTKK
ncbi:murein hydrolase activator EnvC family protein [Aureibacter tunicatorum]|uniref:Septal ring factor EnvC (AmiA/AmiB activator) n=1 Tax=Aureibacter tunicatorum TaxID=866807 RepID=A0AAE3XKL9_9BACT|nr:peptidoglycan DD-metalloendopeptidase family protein [Aureibacter tunicatorum]MDR6237728.1 septal ring factor EnvC (AmiA/AmiB activator) [Aureibacter tunicatorum]BDD02763.1 peptidase M23 [Aureibacter tunicatorum]